MLHSQARNDPRPEMESDLLNGGPRAILCPAIESSISLLAMASTGPNVPGVILVVVCIPRAPCVRSRRSNIPDKPSDRSAADR